MRCLVLLLPFFGATVLDAQGRNLAIGMSTRRMALVIGNSAYEASGRLNNAVNDAEDVGRVLGTELGFTTTILTDMNGAQFDRGVRDFVARLQPGDVALFYYAGHGVQIDGQNYLIPTGFDAQIEADVPYQAYPANRVRDLFRGRGVRLSILILDACRNNPFRSLRSTTGGLAGMSGEGTFVAFAADEGKTASDNPAQRNGLFTQYLLEEIRRPGHIEEVFRRVREKVLEASAGRQHPFTSSGVVGDFYFVAPPNMQTPPPQTAPSSVAAPSGNETEFWKAAREMDVAAAYEEYLRKYPSGEYAGLARIRMEQLRSAKPVQTAAEPVPPSPTNKAPQQADELVGTVWSGTRFQLNKKEQRVNESPVTISFTGAQTCDIGLSSYLPGKWKRVGNQIYVDQVEAGNVPAFGFQSRAPAPGGGVPGSWSFSLTLSGFNLSVTMRHMFGSDSWSGEYQVRLTNQGAQDHPPSAAPKMAAPAQKKR